MAYKRVGDTKAVKLRGGAITSRPKALLPLGAYSMVQNMRPQHPGFEKRAGQIKLHSTADDTNQVMTLYQFNKQRVSEQHFYAQMSDGDILEATNEPPTVTTGVFGTEVFSGSAGQVPASWNSLDDKLIHSNGVDQHQIYGGTSSYVEGCIVYKGAAAIPDIPELGEDYSEQVSDGQASTVAILDALDDLAAFDCVFIKTPVSPSSLTFTIPAGNGNVAATTLQYWNGAWTNYSGQSDSTLDTATSTKTLNQTGTITFTEPTDIIPKYLYGTNGFWCRLIVSDVLDAEVEISGITFSSNWQDIVNVWDGVLTEAIEVQVEGTSTYSVFGSGAVDLNAVTNGKKIMISCADPAVGFYTDVGATPNATGTTITDIKYWNGTAMVSVGTVNDSTSGLSNSGFMTFGRQAAIQPLQFNSSQYYAYWYELTLSATTAADMVVSIQYMPYFSISELGNGVCSTVWKERGMYAFDKWGEYLYVTRAAEPLVLNGSDYGILKAGDGRTNQIVAMRKFHNELMVWQEEKGVEGGCLTLFEGYTPVNFGKLLLSSRLGTFSDKTVEVVDGVLTATATDESIKTLAFFLSRYGVCASDGRTISVISDDIQNYFDPTKAECIRRGYENQMWLKYDSAYNVLRIGLVSGSSATVPNIFPVFDLTDKVWYFDILAQELSCMTEVEAQSGNIPIIQVGGGVNDGIVYRLNTGTNDVAAAIDGHLIMEISNDGFYINLNELMIRMKVQAAGDATVTLTQNELEGSTLTLTMTAEVTNEIIRRHRENVNITNQHIALKIQNATVSQGMFLYDVGLGVDLWEDR